MTASELVTSQQQQHAALPNAASLSSTATSVGSDGISDNDILQALAAEVGRLREELRTLRSAGDRRGVGDQGRVVDYRVVRADQVGALILDGWTPLCGVAFPSSSTKAVQAMVLREAY